MFGIGEIIVAVLRVAFAPTPRRPSRPWRPIERVPEPQVLAQAARYAEWAAARKWSATRAGTFQGVFRGHEAILTTGLAGSAPLSADLVVTIDVEIGRPTLFRRGEDASSSPVARAVFDATESARAVGVTARKVRVTFDKLPDPEAFDRALDAIDAALQDQGNPYRG